MVSVVSRVKDLKRKYSTIMVIEEKKNRVLVENTVYGARSPPMVKVGNTQAGRRRGAWR
jgi:hypothetical protein